MGSIGESNGHQYSVNGSGGSLARGMVLPAVKVPRHESRDLEYNVTCEMKPNGDSLGTKSRTAAGSL